MFGLYMGTPFVRSNFHTVKREGISSNSSTASNVYVRWERYLGIPIFAEQSTTVWQLCKPSWRLLTVSLSMMKKHYILSHLGTSGEVDREDKAEARVTGK